MEDIKNPSESELNRILGFSDGIFAFAITLLALTFDVPKIAPGLVESELFEEIITNQLDNYVSFFISFVVVGSFWISHHQKFKHIIRYNRLFLWLNLFSLMFIVFLPYPTEILGDYADASTAVIFYAVIMAVTSFLFALTWVYAAYNHRLVRKDLSKKYISVSIFYNLSIPLLFILSIPLSFISLDFTRYSWLLVFIVPFLFTRINSNLKEIER